MIIHNVEHTFYYIDPNIKEVAGSEPGDGSSAANAAMDFPSEFSDNVIYLIRRSDHGYFARLPNRVTTSNVTSMVILGMPKEGEEYWDQMPDDAKDLWKDSSITSDYGYVCRYITNYDDWRNDGWNLNACKYFTMRNIGFMRYCSESGWDDVHWMITCNSGFGCNANVQHCRFGDANILVVGSELGNTSTIYNHETDDYKPEYNHGSHYIHFGDSWGNICTIKDCIFDNYGGRTSIYCGPKRNIVLENIKANVRTCAYDENVITWGSETWKAPVVHVKNCEYKFYYANRNGSFRYMPRFIGGWVDRIYVDGMTASIASVQQYNCQDNRLYLRPILDINSRYAGSHIKNITIDFPDFHGFAYQLIAFTYIHDRETIYTSPQEQYNEISDITVNMCQIVGSKYSATGSNDSNGNTWNSEKPGIIRLTSDNYSHSDRGISSDFLIHDLHLNGFRSNMLYAENAIVDLEDTDIIGNIYLYNCVGKIKSVTSWYPGNIVNDGGGNLLYIGKINCNLENTTYLYKKQNSVIVSGRSHILVHEVNGNCWPTGYWAPDYPHSYVCTNDGVAGNYTARTGYSKCETWSSFNDQTDTGCSLRLTNDSKNSDWSWPLRIGGDPFKGITKEVQPGKWNATFYLALYGYNILFDQIRERMFIRIKLPNGKYVYSSEGGCFRDTTTEWSDADLTTNYKFVIPLDIDTAGEIEIDYTWSFDTEGGITLLDPYPKLTARS